MAFRLGKTQVWRCLFLCILCSVCAAIVLGLSVLTDREGGVLGFTFSKLELNRTGSLKHPKNIFPILQELEQQKKVREFEIVQSQSNRGSNSDRREKDIKPINNSGLKTPPKIRMNMAGKTVANVPVNYNIHVFYYPWYRTPEKDGAYYHWNHPLLPHWNEKEQKKWPSGVHQPPDDIGASFYPQLGPYSSSDPDVIDKHMEMIQSAGVGVVVVSWYPPGDVDDAGNGGHGPDSLMPLLLDSANIYNLKVAIHVEPYKNRDHHTMRDNLKYLIEKYGSHPAFYRHPNLKGDNLPLVYIYDSYLVLSRQWAQLLSPKGTVTIRGTNLDAVVIGLVVESKHKTELKTAGFDGFYTYFATNGFTYGSSWNHWKELDLFAKSNHMLFIPSVGPGYIDTAVRPWNGKNIRRRANGQYYNDAFKRALAANPECISITSFNEWHEGTQIEPAVPKNVGKRKYEDYSPNVPEYYLTLTKTWANKFAVEKNKVNA